MNIERIVSVSKITKTIFRWHWALRFIYLYNWVKYSWVNNNHYLFLFIFQDNQSIAHGESFQKVAKKCWDLNPDQLVAIGVNCCAPSYVSKLLKGINDDRPDAPMPLIVYPNSGEKYNPQIGYEFLILLVVWYARMYYLQCAMNISVN